MYIPGGKHVNLNSFASLKVHCYLSEAQTYFPSMKAWWNFSESMFKSFCLFLANNSGVNKRQITDLVDQSIQINAHCFVVTADNRYILICGFWDKSFRVYSTETGNLHNKSIFPVFKRCWKHEDLNSLLTSCLAALASSRITERPCFQNKMENN